MTTRIYTVTNKASGRTRLIRATNQAQALRHVWDDTLEASVPTQDELIKLAVGGIAVEEIQSKPEAVATDAPAAA